MSSTDKEPPGPRGTPGIQNLADFSADPTGFIGRCAREFGDVVWLGQDNYLLCHPRDIEYVLVNNRRLFFKVDASEQKPSWAKPGSYHYSLMFTDGDDWHYKRRLLQPAFKSDRVEASAAPIVEAAENMIACWRPGQALPIEREVTALGAQLVAHFLLGSALSSDEVRRLTSMRSWEYRPLPIPLPNWLPTPEMLRFKWSLRQFERSVWKMIDRLRGPSNGSAKLLDLVQRARDGEDGCQAPAWYPRDELAVMLLAGYHPMALALAWTFYMVSLHPEVDARLAAEVDHTLGHRRATAEDRERLVYTTAVIKESMRLYPPVWMTTRESLEECEIGGYRVRPGINLALSPWVTHRDPRWFADPEAFRPERWLDGSLDGLPKCAYMPFGSGPRVCIGLSFSMQTLVLVVATVARRYRLALAKGAKVSTLVDASFLMPQGLRLVPAARA